MLTFTSSYEDPLLEGSNPSQDSVTDCTLALGGIVTDTVLKDCRHPVSSLSGASPGLKSGVDHRRSQVAEDRDEICIGRDLSSPSMARKLNFGEKPV